MSMLYDFKKNGDVKMNWEVTIKEEDETVIVDKEILQEKHLILNTKGFCIVDMDQVVDEFAYQSQNNEDIIDKEKFDEHLDIFIEQIYDYAYDLLEDFANRNEYKIKE